MSPAALIGYGEQGPRPRADAIGWTEEWGVASGLPRPPGATGGRAAGECPGRGEGLPDCGTFLVRGPHAVWPDFRLVCNYSSFLISSISLFQRRTNGKLPTLAERTQVSGQC